MADEAAESVMDKTSENAPVPMETDEPASETSGAETETNDPSQEDTSAVSAEETTAEKVETHSEDTQPADVKTTETSAEEKQSSQDDNCYCGKERRFNKVEFICTICQKWFHADCLTCYLGPCAPMMTNYQFFCKKCSTNGKESFTKKQASFSQMCLTALANLSVMHPSKSMFSKDRDIIPYIEKHWEDLTNVPRRKKINWHSTITKTLAKDADVFIYQESASGDAMYALAETMELGKIGPSCELLLKGSSSQRTSAATEVRLGATDFSVGSRASTRGTKRKAPGENLQLPAKLKRSDVLVTTKAPHGFPLEHPFNKDGYRYILAEPDPHAPNRQAFDESVEWAGKPIPGYLYRTYLSPKVLLAMHDRAPQLKLSEDRLSATGEKGYSMIRATQGVRRGAWYFEVTMDEMPPDTAVRLGWSQSLGNLQAPCGYDKFSYSWRSCKGTRFHQSRGKHYSDGYSEGDVLGFYIYLPNPSDPEKLLPPTSKEKPLIKFKSHLYYEEKDYVAEAERNLKPAAGSKIIFFRNGENCSTAYTDIYEGTYYPAISLYKNTTISVNFGPDFKHPPKDIGDFRPMSEAALESVVEQTVADIVYHIEHEGQWPEF